MDAKRSHFLRSWALPFSKLPAAYNCTPQSLLVGAPQSHQKLWRLEVGGNDFHGR